MIRFLFLQVLACVETPGDGHSAHPRALPCLDVLVSIANQDCVRGFFVQVLQETLDGAR